MLKSIFVTKTMRKWQVQVICCAGKKPEITVHVSLCIASNELISTDIKLHTTYIGTICHGRYISSVNCLHYLEPGRYGPELSKLANYILILWNICKLDVHVYCTLSIISYYWRREFNQLPETWNKIYFTAVLYLLKKGDGMFVTDVVESVVTLCHDTLRNVLWITLYESMP